jgi:uncharacterized protein YfdQ (DUF2303 family)
MNTTVKPIEAIRDAHAAGIIRDLSIATAKPVEIDPERVVGYLVPEGMRVELVDGIQYSIAPRRETGIVRVDTVDSLISYTRRHDDESQTTLWVDSEASPPMVSAVINDHSYNQLGLPGWKDHRAVLPLVHTDEWKHWANTDNRWLTQEQFAEHIQAGLADITSPDGAEILEIAQTLQGTQKAEWRNAVRLRDGQVRMEWVETARATAGEKGELEIPAEFKLSISPFLGEQACVVTARFFYRLRDKAMMFRYQLDRPQLLIRESLTKITERLRTEFPAPGDDSPLAARVFLGCPSVLVQS